MDKEQVLEIVISELSDVAKIDRNKIKPESSLMDELDISSLEILVLIGNLESKTGVTITQEDSAGIETVNDIVEKIISKQQV